jgi:hypothetical protein
VIWDNLSEGNILFSEVRSKGQYNMLWEVNHQSYLAEDGPMDAEPALGSPAFLAKPLDGAGPKCVIPRSLQGTVVIFITVCSLSVGHYV